MKSFEARLVYTTEEDITEEEFADWIVEMAEKDGYMVYGKVVLSGGKVLKI